MGALLLLAWLAIASTSQSYSGHLKARPNNPSLRRCMLGTPFYRATPSGTRLPLKPFARTDVGAEDDDDAKSEAAKQSILESLQRLELDSETQQTHVDSGGSSPKDLEGSSWGEDEAWELLEKEAAEDAHPRDYFLTVYGRKPVLEALQDENLKVDKLLVARGARGELISEILRMADERGIQPKRCHIDQVHRLSGNQRQDQGVALDLIQPKVFLEDWIQSVGDKPLSRPLVVLDGVRNAQNIGMILRTATAAGAAGVVIPRKGSPGLGPLVIKASAGVALRAKILHCEDPGIAARALKADGWSLVGLSGGPGSEDLFELDLEGHERLAWVLGNESDGISSEVAEIIDRWVRIPMENGVESLNVATAASVVLFELMRLRKTGLV